MYIYLFKLCCRLLGAAGQETRRRIIRFVTQWNVTHACLSQCPIRSTSWCHRRSTNYWNFEFEQISHLCYSWFLSGLKIEPRTDDITKYSFYIYVRISALTPIWPMLPSDWLRFLSQSHEYLRFHEFCLWLSVTIACCFSLLMLPWSFYGDIKSIFIFYVVLLFWTATVPHAHKLNRCMPPCTQQWRWFSWNNNPNPLTCVLHPFTWKLHQFTWISHLLT